MLQFLAFVLFLFPVLSIVICEQSTVMLHLSIVIVRKKKMFILFWFIFWTEEHSL